MKHFPSLINNYNIKKYIVPSWCAQWLSISLWIQRWGSIPGQGTCRLNPQEGEWGRQQMDDSHQWCFFLSPFLFLSGKKKIHCLKNPERNLEIQLFQVTGLLPPTPLSASLLHATFPIFLFFPPLYVVSWASVDKPKASWRWFENDLPR